VAQCLAILAPSGRDATVIQGILESAALRSSIETSIERVLDSVDQVRAGAAIIAEEGLTDVGIELCEAWLSRQPPWSDLPIILLTRARSGANTNLALASRLGNVTILERPLHPVTLVSAAKAALRARARQHEAEKHVLALERSERRLRESEAKYRALFRSMDEGFCIIEFLDGRDGPLSDYIHVEANEAYARHSGIEDVVGQRVREMVPDEAEEWVKIYGEVLRTGESIRFERELVATGRHLELAAFRIEPPERRQVAVLFQDITARRAAEIALQELNATLERRISEALAERRLLAELVEGTNSLVQVIDPDFRFLAINKAAIEEHKRLYKVVPKVGDNKLATLDDMPDQRDLVRKLWQRALNGEAFSEVLSMDDPEGGRRYFEAKFSPLYAASGELIGAYQFADDVTERLRDQQRLTEATERMHEMAKLETLGQLTGGVAHDFNNLLTPIVGALDMLRRRLDGDERSNRLISGALQASQRAATLVQRLLSFARRQHLETRTVDVGELVDGMSDLIQRTIGPHITVKIEQASDLPPARIDPGQLELAILNLAVNARDAMAGGGTLTVKLDEATLEVANGLEPGRYIRVAVIDTGVGMDELTLSRAIEPFFTTKGQGEGTGLGLSMIHGLAAQSGGALKIHSKVGKGTTAEIWLPAADGRAESLQVRDEVLTAQPRRATILLVDDEELVRAATAEMLRDMGHRVIQAETGAAAISCAKSGDPIDLLITDYLMPGLRGSELAEELRRQNPNLPVLLMTGYANLAKGEAVGLPRLSKPFREADLAREVSNLLTAETPAERRKKMKPVA
jgi:PAS domain S-box-containing protein